MHEGEPYGFLTTRNKDTYKDIPKDGLARILGISYKDVEVYLEELESAGVCSRNDAGLLYSRRMVRDDKLRALRAAGGVKSLRNPNVARPKRSRKKDTLKDIYKDTYKDGTTCLPQGYLPHEEEEEERRGRINTIGREGSGERGVRKACVLPSDFSVSEAMRSWALNRVPSISVTLETEKFINYWRSNGKKKVDWEATWRNWMLNARKFDSGGVNARTDRILGLAKANPDDYPD
jgi:hypothetical protein